MCSTLNAVLSVQPMAWPCRGDNREIRLVMTGRSRVSHAAAQLLMSDPNGAVTVMLFRLPETSMN